MASRASIAPKPQGNKELARINQVLRTGQDDWKARVKAVQDLEKLTIQVVDANGADTFGTELLTIVSAVSTQLGDLRSEIVKCVCTTVVTICEYLGDDASKFAAKIFDAALNTAASTNGVIRGYGQQCVLNVVSLIQNRDILILLSSQLKASKSDLLRSLCMQLIDIIVEKWNPTYLRKNNLFQMICDCIVFGAGAASPDARKAAVHAAALICKNFPEIYKVLSQSLDSRTSRAVKEMIPKLDAEYNDENEEEVDNGYEEESQQEEEEEEYQDQTQEEEQYTYGQHNQQNHVYDAWSNQNQHQNQNQNLNNSSLPSNSRSNSTAVNHRSSFPPAAAYTQPTNSQYTSAAPPSPTTAARMRALAMGININAPPSASATPPLYNKPLPSSQNSISSSANVRVPVRSSSSFSGSSTPIQPAAYSYPSVTPARSSVNPAPPYGAIPQLSLSGVNANVSAAASPSTHVRSDIQPPTSTPGPKFSFPGPPSASNASSNTSSINANNFPMLNNGVNVNNGIIPTPPQPQKPNFPAGLRLTMKNLPDVDDNAFEAAFKDQFADSQGLIEMSAPNAATAMVLNRTLRIDAQTAAALAAAAAANKDESMTPSASGRSINDQSRQNSLVSSTPSSDKSSSPRHSPKSSAASPPVHSNSKASVFSSNSNNVSQANSVTSTPISTYTGNRLIQDSINSNGSVNINNLSQSIPKPIVNITPDMELNDMLKQLMLGHRSYALSNAIHLQKISQFSNVSAKNPDSIPEYVNSMIGMLTEHLNTTNQMLQGFITYKIKSQASRRKDNGDGSRLSTASSTPLQR